MQSGQCFLGTCILAFLFATVVNSEASGSREANGSLRDTKAAGYKAYGAVFPVSRAAASEQTEERVSTESPPVESSGPKQLPSAQPENDSVEARSKEVPGITAVLYPEFFAKASRAAVQLLKENFRKIRLKSASAVAHVPVIGDFKIKLESVQLEGLKLDKTTTGVSLGQDGKLVLIVRGLDAVVNGHLRWRRTEFPFISGGCQAEVTAEDGNATLRVEVIDDGSGRPTIQDIQTADLSFASLSIHTSGAKLAWLYNAVAALAKTPIQDAITQEVAAQLTTTAPALVDKLLLGVPTVVDVKGLQLNVSLASSPIVSADKLLVLDWGRFQNPESHTKECPFSRQRSGTAGDVVVPYGSPYMVIANLDESIANCLTWDMYIKGMLHHFFVGDDLPKQALYTDTWRFIIPALYNRCPGCPMALNASVTSAPQTHFDPSRGITTSGTAELSFYLADAKGISSPHQMPTAASHRLLQAPEETSAGQLQAGKLMLGQHMFTLSLAGELVVPELRLERDPTLKPDRYRIFMTMKVNQSALAVDVVRSEIGDINKAALHVALTIGAFLVEDQVNHGILKDGFTLPEIPHIKVQRANISVGESVLALGSDLAYVTI